MSATEVLKRLEWYATHIGSTHNCPICYRAEGDGHASDCALAAALDAGDGEVERLRAALQAIAGTPAYHIPIHDGEYDYELCEVCLEMIDGARRALDGGREGTNVT